MKKISCFLTVLSFLSMVNINYLHANSSEQNCEHLLNRVTLSTVKDFFNDFLHLAVKFSVQILNPEIQKYFGTDYTPVAPAELQSTISVLENMLPPTVENRELNSVIVSIKRKLKKLEKSPRQIAIEILDLVKQAATTYEKDLITASVALYRAQSNTDENLGTISTHLENAKTNIQIADLIGANTSYGLALAEIEKYLDGNSFIKLVWLETKVALWLNELSNLNWDEADQTWKELINSKNEAMAKFILFKVLANLEDASILSALKIAIGHSKLNDEIRAALLPILNDWVLMNQNATSAAELEADGDEAASRLSEVEAVIKELAGLGEL